MFVNSGSHGMFLIFCPLRLYKVSMWALTTLSSSLSFFNATWISVVSYSAPDK